MTSRGLLRRLPSRLLLLPGELGVALAVVGLGLLAILEPERGDRAGGALEPQARQQLFVLLTQAFLVRALEVEVYLVDPASVGDVHLGRGGASRNRPERHALETFLADGDLLALHLQIRISGDRLTHPRLDLFGLEVVGERNSRRSLPAVSSRRALLGPPQREPVGAVVREALALDVPCGRMRDRGSNLGDARPLRRRHLRGLLRPCRTALCSKPAYVCRASPYFVERFGNFL